MCMSNGVTHIGIKEMFHVKNQHFSLAMSWKRLQCQRTSAYCVKNGISKSKIFIRNKMLSFDIVVLCFIYDFFGLTALTQTQLILVTSKF